MAHTSLFSCVSRLGRDRSRAGDVVAESVAVGACPGMLPQRVCLSPGLRSGADALLRRGAGG